MRFSRSTARRELLLTLLTLTSLLLMPTTLAQTTGARLALKGYDPVLLIDGQEKEGSQDHEVIHGGFLYRFVGEETQARFEEDPERYGIQGDGHCTTMPSARANPSIFTVHEGHIYAFGTPHCKTEFLANPDLFLKDEEDPSKVAILVYDGVELLDFAGPGASLHLVGRLLGNGMADGTAAYMEYERRPANDGVRRASVGTR